MKRLVLFLSLVFLIQSCKSSYSKTELLKENKALKERIKKLETADTVNQEAAFELKKMNVVYRGVANPIYISKPNAVSFEATAFGLKKLDSLGNYNLSPGTGKTVDIIIKSKLKNGDSLTETKTLRIKDIDMPKSLLNGIGCNSSKCELMLTKKELKNAAITLDSESLVLDFEVTGFKLKVPNQDGITITGNVIPKEVNKIIDNLKKDNQVYLFNIDAKIKNYHTSNSIRICKIRPIIIRIVEDN